MKRRGKRITKGKRFSSMETMNAASTAGLFQPVPSDSKIFLSSILPVLQNSYFHADSRTRFRYSGIHLVNGGTQRNGYQAFHAEKLEGGYTEEELEETYGFLLYDRQEEAKDVCEKGLRIGHTTSSLLGDPSKGVYAWRHSDCLDRRSWYHGRSGFIVILRLTKGRVRPVRENLTQSFTAPTAGYDCHVWEQSGEEPSPSATPPYQHLQYFLYELCGQGEGVAMRPRHVLPFALVGFSYVDTAPGTPEDSSADSTVLHYHPWRGQIQVQSLVYHVGLRCNSESLTPAQLPAVLAVDRAMSILVLRTLFPQDVFEARSGSEVSLEGMFFSLYEVVTSVPEDSSLAVLTQELKNKGLALVLQLNAVGLLVLLSSSHSHAYRGNAESLLAMFVFPDSRAVQEGLQILRSRTSLVHNTLQVLPGLDYAETEVDKCPPEQPGALCEMVEQHLQSYAALNPPGKADGASGETSCFRQQYETPEMLNHVYSAFKCGKVKLQRLQAYLGHPEAYTLPMARAMGLLAVRQKGRRNVQPANKAVRLICVLRGRLTGPRRRRSGHSKKKKKKKKKKKMTESETATVTQPTVQTSLEWDCRIEEQPVMMQPLPPRRKGFGYGLKTIVTDCGRMFVPHGSAMPSEDITSLAESRRAAHLRAERLAWAAALPTDAAGQQASNTELPEPHTSNTELPEPQASNTAEQAPSRDPAEGLETAVPAGATVSPPVEHDILKSSEPEIIPAKNGAKASEGSKPLISFKELRTVFQNIKRKLKCPDGQNLGRFGGGLANGEPQQKKNKDTVNESRGSEVSEAVSPKGTKIAPRSPKTQSGKPRKADRPEGMQLRRVSPRRLDLQKRSLQPDQPDQPFQTLESQGPPTPQAKPAKTKPFKKQLRSRITESTKENISSDSPASPSREKRGPPQEVRGYKLQVSSGDDSPVSEPDSTTDALTLLADLALGSGGERTPTNLSPTRETSPATLHLPLRSPNPEGLVVGGKFILIISQEHSYSGTGGTQGATQPSPQSVADTSSPSGPQEPLPLGQNADSPKATTPQQCPVAERRKRGLKWTRSVVHVGDTIRVTRQWTDKYEFGQDSKYTNEPLVKAVLRALHGPWDSGCEETFQQTRLILHTWIGLFYSKSTTRFFPTDPKGPLPEGHALTLKAGKKSQVEEASLATSPSPAGPRDPPAAPPAAPRDPPAAPPAAPRDPPAAPPAAPQPLEEVLDLREDSKKVANASPPCSKVLDLSKKHSEALDLSAVSKHSGEATATHCSTQRNIPKNPLIPFPPQAGYSYTIFYPVLLYSTSTCSEFSHKGHRPSIDIISDDGSEQMDDGSSCHEDDNDGNRDLLEPDQLLTNDDACAQMCEHIASLYISKDMFLNGRHRGRKLMSGRTLRSNYSLRSLNRERDIRTSRTKRGPPWIQPSRFSNICHTAPAALQLISLCQTTTGAFQTKNICRSASKALQPISASDHESKGTVVAEGHDGNDFSERETCPAVHDGIGLSQEKACTAMHDGSDFTKENASAAVHDGNDLSKEDTSTALHDGCKENASTAVHDRCKEDASAAVHDGNDLSKEDTSTALHDGCKENASTALHDGCKENASTAVHDGCKEDASTAVHDGNDFSKEDTSTALHDGCKENASTAVHDGNDFSKEDTSTALHDGCKEDASTAVHDGNDFSQEDESTAVHDGNDFSKEDASTAVHDGIDFSKQEASTAVHDGIDFSRQEVSTSVHDGNDFSKQEVSTVVDYGNDFSEQEACTSVHDGIDFSKQKLSTAVHDGTDFSKQEASTAVHDGIDFSRQEVSTAVHDENDFSKQEVSTVVDYGNDYSKEDASTAVHDGCKENASTAVHDGNDFSQDDAPTAVHDVIDFSKRKLSTAVHDGTDFSKQEASTAVHDGIDFSRQVVSTAVYDENDFSKQEVFTAVHDGNGFSEQEASTAVHDGNYITKGKEHTADGSKEGPFTPVHDGNDLDEEFKADLDENVTKGEEHKADLNEIIDGSDSSGEEMAAAVFGGRRDSVTEMQMAFPNGDDSSNVSDLEESVNKIRSPTPIHDEFPSELNLYLSGSQSGTPASDGSSSNSGSRSVTPTQDELPCDPESYRYSSCSLATEGLLDSGVDPLGSNNNDESSAYLPQCGDEPCPSSTLVCTQRPPSALGAPFSCDSPASDHDSEDSHEPQPLSEDEYSFTSSSSSEEVSHCTVSKSVLTDVFRPHSRTADEERVTLSEGNRLPQELSSPDSLHRNSEASRQSDPTDGQSPKHGDLSSSSLVSDANPQYGAVLPLKDDSLISQSEPAGSSDKAANADGDYGRDPKMASDTVSPPSPCSGVVSAERFLSCPAIGGTSSEVPNPIEDSQLSSDRSPSKSNDGNVVDLLDGSLEVIPTSNQTNHHLSKENSELCPSVTGSQSTLNADCLHHPQQPFSDGKNVRHESLADSNPVYLSECSTSSPGPGSNSSTSRSAPDSVYRERDPTRTSVSAGDLQDVDRNSKQCISPVSAPSPPVPAACRPHMPRKRLRKSVRASTSQERQGGSDTRLAMEGGSMRSPARMKDSSDQHTAAADWSKSFAQEVDIERCTMLGDRESVSSGSFSDAVGGKDAVRSPVGEYSSDEQEIDEAFDHSKASEGIGWNWASCSVPHKGTDAAERDPFFDRRGGIKREPQTCVEEEGNEGSAVRPSIISVLDYRGNRRTYENYPITKMVSSNPTAPAPDSRKKRCHLQSVLQEWKRPHQTQTDLTQSSLDMQYLIFSEKMNQILKKNQPTARSSDSTRYPWRKRSSSDVDCSPCGGPVMLQVSQDHISVKPISNWRMKREKHERVGPRDAEFSAGYYPLDCATPQRLRRLSQSAGFGEPSSVVSNIAGECSRSYRAMMNNVCSGKKARHRPDRPQSRRTVKPHTDSSRKQTKADRGSGQCSDVKAAVRLSWKGIFRFHILVTSSDAFFEQTKALLEAEGHASVEPDQFDLKGQNSASPLLIILRNEDIADYISTIPRLVELKKTPGVRFAGVDQPDDVLNHTHQELFREGGFTVCDADALGSFTYDYVKRLVGFLNVLRDRSRWKWFLHYRDSRELRESARRSSEARRLQQLVDRCQEAGLVEVLPYHECDAISRDRPDYLSCLLRLQVQHAAMRFPVFITDTPEDSFEKCGILAMNLDTFSRSSPTDTFTLL